MVGGGEAEREIEKRRDREGGGTAEGKRETEK